MHLKPVADMTADEAAFHLSDFLAQGAATATELVGRAKAAGVDADYSVASVPAVMRWAAADVRLVLRDPDPNLPDWIDPASHDWRDLDPASAPTVLTIAYYMGESFVRDHPDRLRWTTGNPEYAFTNQPVVDGFGRGMQLSPVVVTSSLYLRTTKHPERSRDLETAMNVWLGYLDLT